MLFGEEDRFPRWGRSFCSPAFADRAARPDIPHRFDPDDAVGETQGGLQRVGEARLDPRLDHQAVDDDLDGVLLVLVELGGLGQLIKGAVDTHPHETVGLQLFQLLAVFPLALPHHRRQKEEPRPFGHGEDAVDHLLHRLAGDLLAALVAMHPADPGKEEAQVIVDFGDGADGGTGILRGRLLLDGDRRGKPLDRLDIGLLHLLEELAGVGGEGFDIAPLPLGINGIEGQGRFTRAGDAGDDHQLVAGDGDVDALEVVLASAFDDDLVVGHELTFLWKILLVREGA